MVIKIKIEKQKMLYDNGFEWLSTIFIDEKFYKEIGGLSSFKDLIKVTISDLGKNLISDV